MSRFCRVKHGEDIDAQLPSNIFEFLNISSFFSHLQHNFFNKSKLFSQKNLTDSFKRIGSISHEILNRPWNILRGEKILSLLKWNISLLSQQSHDIRSHSL